MPIGVGVGVGAGVGAGDGAGEVVGDGAGAGGGEVEEPFPDEPEFDEPELDELEEPFPLEPELDVPAEGEGVAFDGVGAGAEGPELAPGAGALGATEEPEKLVPDEPPPPPPPQAPRERTSTSARDERRMRVMFILEGRPRARHCAFERCSPPAQTTRAGRLWNSVRERRSAATHDFRASATFVVSGREPG